MVSRSSSNRSRRVARDVSFNEYTLPDAILRFRQGFGRLIRRKTDRGVVILLDNRIWRKGYGQAFLDDESAGHVFWTRAEHGHVIDCSAHGQGADIAAGEKYGVHGEGVGAHGNGAALV